MAIELNLLISFIKLNSSIYNINSIGQKTNINILNYIFDYEFIQQFILEHFLLNERPFMNLYDEKEISFENYFESCIVESIKDLYLKKEVKKVIRRVFINVKCNDNKLLLWKLLYFLSLIIAQYDHLLIETHSNENKIINMNNKYFNEDYFNKVINNTELIQGHLLIISQLITFSEPDFISLLKVENLISSKEDQSFQINTHYAIKQENNYQTINTEKDEKEDESIINNSNIIDNYSTNYLTNTKENNHINAYYDSDKEDYAENYNFLPFTERKKLKNIRNNINLSPLKLTNNTNCFNCNQKQKEIDSFNEQNKTLLNKIKLIEENSENIILENNKLIKINEGLKESNKEIVIITKKLKTERELNKKISNEIAELSILKEKYSELQKNYMSISQENKENKIFRKSISLNSNSKLIHNDIFDNNINCINNALVEENNNDLLKQIKELGEENIKYENDQIKFLEKILKLKKENKRLSKTENYYYIALILVISMFFYLIYRII